MRIGNEFREVKITKEIFDYYKPTFDIEFHKEGKIFYVKYDNEHSQMPEYMYEYRVDGRVSGGRRKCITKTYNQFMNVVHQYCEDRGFKLKYRENETGWCKYNDYHYDILIPKSFGWNYSVYEWSGHPIEWYGVDLFRELHEKDGDAYSPSFDENSGSSIRIVWEMA